MAKEVLQIFVKQTVIIKIIKGSNFGITPKGTLVGVPQGDNKNIYEFDINN